MDNSAGRGQVIPLRKASAPAPCEPAPAYAELSRAAREAYAGLKGLQSRLDRIFGGSFTTVAAKAEIEQLTTEIRLQAQAVYKLSR